MITIRFCSHFDVKLYNVIKVYKVQRKQRAELANEMQLQYNKSQIY